MPQSPLDTVTPTVQPMVVPPMVAWSRWVAVISLVGLIVLCLGWELLWAPLRPGGSWLALKVLPLCIPLAGLLKNRMYTYRWVSLVVWLYFIEGVVRGWSDKYPGNILAWGEVALCLVLFVACTVHIRLRLKNAKRTLSDNAPQNASLPSTAS